MLLADIDVGLIVNSTQGLMDPANRLESWEEEGEGRVEMTVTERVVPYDLLHSEEAFYWSSVCRSVPLCVCVVLVLMVCVVEGTCTILGTREVNSWRRFFQHCPISVSTFKSMSHTYKHTRHAVLSRYVERELLKTEEVEEKIQKQFVSQQLLSIFSVMDLSDEVGR